MANYILAAIEEKVSKIYLDMWSRSADEIDEEITLLTNNGYVCTGQIGGGDEGSFMVLELETAETKTKAQEHRKRCEDHWKMINRIVFGL